MPILLVLIFVVYKNMLGRGKRSHPAVLAWLFCDLFQCSPTILACWTYLKFWEHIIGTSKNDHHDIYQKAKPSTNPAIQDSLSLLSILLLYNLWKINSCLTCNLFGAKMLDASAFEDAMLKTEALKWHASFSSIYQQYTVMWCFYFFHNSFD